MAISFTNAPKVKETAKTKKGLPELPTSGMCRLAAIDAAIKTLTALQKAESEKIKSQMTDYFATEGASKGARPTNFAGVETVMVDIVNSDGELIETPLSARGSCELKSRASSSPLTDDEIKILMQNNIPFGEKVTAEETFLINPQYSRDMEMLGKVEEALKNVDLPDDFLLHQEKRSGKVVSGETIDALFSTKDKEIIKAILPVATVLSIKPAITEGNFWAMMDEVMAG